MNTLKKGLLSAWKIIDRYPVIFSALLIYTYYLLVSIDLFAHFKEKKSIVDYVLRFDALIWMWVAVAAFLQVLKYRRRHSEESEARGMYQHELERQQAQHELLNDITSLLQDNINNPLAIISLRTQDLRRKFEESQEVLLWANGIESAVKRIERTVRELKSYETQRILKSSSERLQRISPASGE